MATTGTNKRHALAAVLLASSFAHAEFSPEVTAGISHTDNVFLDAVDEDTELVYRLEPSFHFSKETQALSVNADYLLQALRYRDIGETEVYHQYEASLRAALIPDTFFLEVGGNRSQAIVDPEQTIPLSNLPISGNRQNLDEYYAAPSFQYDLGNDVAATGEYRHSWLEYGGAGAESARLGEAHFSLDNYRRERGLTWALRYDWQRADYELEIPWEYQTAMVELGFWAGANTRLFAAAGKESAWDEPLDPKLEDDLWEAGIAHQVGERLSLEFAAGERSFGSSLRGNLEYRFRRGSTTLSYAETPTTEGLRRFRRGVFDGPEVPDDFLSEPGSPERFIAKRLAWTLNLELRRTSLALSLFNGDRTDRTDIDGTPLPDESQRGANLVITYDLGARTELQLGGFWTDRDRRVTGKSELIHGFFTTIYELGQRTALSLTYDYAEEDPVGEEEETGARDYVANTVSLDLTRTF